MEKFPASLVKPALDYIDNGNFFRQPFRILYIVFAVLSALVPLFALYKIIETGLFRYASAGLIIGIILAWLVMLAGFAAVGLIWWTRSGQLATTGHKGDEYPVTPVFAHLVRTGGETLGVIVGGVMFLVSLILLIFAGGAGHNLLSMGMGDLGGGWATVFLMPVCGFLIIVFSRFLSEQIRALVNIAQNTKK